MLDHNSGRYVIVNPVYFLFHRQMIGPKTSRVTGCTRHMRCSRMQNRLAGNRKWGEAILGGLSYCRPVQRDTTPCDFLRNAKIYIKWAVLDLNQ
jgi:hypothetical protein